MFSFLSFSFALLITVDDWLASPLYGFMYLPLEVCLSELYIYLLTHFVCK